MRLLLISVLALTIESVFGCEKWCFDKNKCFIPDKSDCAKCVSLTCYNDFYYPFSNCFGASCVKHAVATCCNAVCGYPSYYEVHNKFKKCKECLYPCIDEAKLIQEECFPHPPPEQPIEVQVDPLCSDCVGSGKCFNETELMTVSPFCLGYISLSCQNVQIEEMGIDMSALIEQLTQDAVNGNTRGQDELYYPIPLLQCIQKAFEDPCSKCPPLEGDRIYVCGMCLNECIPKAACALKCSYKASGPHTYPTSMPCLECANLCEVTPGDKEKCFNKRCPNCKSCDKCYEKCDAYPGIIKNTCRCKLGYYIPVTYLVKK